MNIKTVLSVLVVGVFIVLACVYRKPYPSC
jgi:hypothetical protein